jgi:hypothetical protein
LAQQTVKGDKPMFPVGYRNPKLILAYVTAVAVDTFNILVGKKGQTQTWEKKCVTPAHPQSGAL